MSTMKLKVTDDLMLHLEKMKSILAGSPVSTGNEFVTEGCGAHCKVTCAHYCHATCEAQCKLDCSAECQTACGGLSLYTGPPSTYGCLGMSFDFLD